MISTILLDYGQSIGEFLDRLHTKHYEKGLEHRDKNILELWGILQGELLELQPLIYDEGSDSDTMKEEALDVAISALLIVDWVNEM